MGKEKYKLSNFEMFWYYLTVICSLGFWYSVKVVIKKALSEE